MIPKEDKTFVNSNTQAKRQNLGKQNGENNFFSKQFFGIMTIN